MKLFIKVKGGVPQEHPMLLENIVAAFPGVNPEAADSGFAPFVRVGKPAIGVYDVYDRVTYELVDGVYTDVHHVRPMTEEEKAAKQAEAQAVWAQHGYPSWTFNEEFCRFDPPIPRPVDGKGYRWEEASLSWVEITDV